MAEGKSNLTTENGIEQDKNLCAILGISIICIAGIFLFKKIMTNNSNDLGNFAKDIIKTGADNGVANMEIIIESDSPLEMGGDIGVSSFKAEVGDNEKISIKVQYRS